eukprot:Nk52_evm14s1485 gene=Nk52_evmTU14s1485
MNSNMARVSQASFTLESEIAAINKNHQDAKVKEAEAGLSTYHVKEKNVDEAFCPVQAADGKSPTIWSRKYIGLACSYYIVGIFLGLAGILQPLVLIVNHKQAPFFASSQQLITIFWSYKIFYGFFIDYMPILGYSKKMYQLIGSGISIAILFVLAFTADTLSIEAILGIMTVQNFFSVMADCANDGFTCHLSHRETESDRGKTLSLVYSTRFVGTMVTYVIAALGTNGPSYKGSFDFDLSMNNIFLVLGCVSAIAYPFLFFCMDEERYVKQDVKRTFTGEMKALKDILMNRAIYQLMFFMLVNQTFMGFQNNVNTNFATDVLRMNGFQNNMNFVFQYILLFGGMAIVKKWGLRYNWVYMFIGTFLVQLVLINFVWLFVWDVSHDSWLYVVLSATNQLPYGMNFIVSSFFMVEIAAPGHEALVFGLFSTVHNICIPLATVLSNQLMSAFDNLSNDDIKADTNDFRESWSYYQLAVTGIMMMCLVVMPLFPRQKEEARALARKSSNRFLAISVLILCILALIYATVCTILTIVPSTQCMTFIGGGGC